jgi:hypothetical protein
MAFKGRDTIRSKTEIENSIIEQINSFNCLGNLIPHENEMDIGNKLSNYVKITRIINNIFRPKRARIKLYNTQALQLYYTAVRSGQ